MSTNYDPNYGVPPPQVPFSLTLPSRSHSPRLHHFPEMNSLPRISHLPLPWQLSPPMSSSGTQERIIEGKRESILRRARRTQSTPLISPITASYGYTPVHIDQLISTLTSSEIYSPFTHHSRMNHTSYPGCTIASRENCGEDVKQSESREWQYPQYQEYQPTFSTYTTSQDPPPIFNSQSYVLHPPHPTMLDSSLPTPVTCDTPQLSTHSLIPHFSPNFASPRNPACLTNNRGVSSKENEGIVQSDYDVDPEEWFDFRKYFSGCEVISEGKELDIRGQTDLVVTIINAQELKPHFSAPPSLSCILNITPPHSKPYTVLQIETPSSGGSTFAFYNTTPYAKDGVYGDGEERVRDQVKEEMSPTPLSRKGGEEMNGMMGGRAVQRIEDDSDNEDDLIFLQQPLIPFPTLVSTSLSNHLGSSSTRQPVPEAQQHRLKIVSDSPGEKGLVTNGLRMKSSMKSAGLEDTKSRMKLGTLEHDSSGEEMVLQMVEGADLDLEQDITWMKVDGEERKSKKSSMPIKQLIPTRRKYTRKAPLPQFSDRRFETQSISTATSMSTAVKIGNRRTGPRKPIVKTVRQPNKRHGFRLPPESAADSYNKFDKGHEYNVEEKMIELVEIEDQMRMEEDDGGSRIKKKGRIPGTFDIEDQDFVPDRSSGRLFRTQPETSKRNGDHHNDGARLESEEMLRRRGMKRGSRGGKNGVCCKEEELDGKVEMEVEEGLGGDTEEMEVGDNLGRGWRKKRRSENSSTPAPATSTNGLAQLSSLTSSTPALNTRLRSSSVTTSSSIDPVLTRRCSSIVPAIFKDQDLVGERIVKREKMKNGYVLETYVVVVGGHEGG